MDENGDFAAYAQDEAQALVGLLETPGRKVMVLVVAIENAGDGYDVGLCRAVSRGTSLAEADALLQGVDRHAARIMTKMEKK